MKYVLITPARNEEAFIEKTLDSMVRQTLAPERWVIIDDGSTDRTAEIVKKYRERCHWIELVQRPRASPGAEATGRCDTLRKRRDRWSGYAPPAHPEKAAWSRPP